MFIARCWRDHSLSIVLTLIGVGLVVVAFQHEPGNWFDLWLTLGGGFLTVAGFYLAAGWLREKNKPET